MEYNSANTCYFDWLTNIVMPGGQTRDHKSYHRLIAMLFDSKFYPLMNTDDARVDDVYAMRSQYTDIVHMDPASADGFVRQGFPSCSMLELMVALARRMENHIMADSEYGDRTSQWFWEMVSSLGLSSMDDSNFDDRLSGVVISQFVNREFAKNGCGSLFTIHNPDIDMRDLDLWYQMHAYINELMNGGKF